MKDKLLGNRVHFIVLCNLCLILVFFYVTLFLINRDIINQYEDMILPSIYLDDIDMSNYEYGEAYDVIEDRIDDILLKKVHFIFHDKEVDFTLKDIGVVIDYDKTFNSIKKYQRHLSYSKKIWYINGHNDSYVLPFYFKINEEEYDKFLKELENSVNISPVNGYFDTSVGVKYIPGKNGYQIDEDKTRVLLQKYFDGNYDDSKVIELKGREVSASNNKKYASIDTMTSSFSTSYDTWLTNRVQNLKTGLSYINGTIIEPGEVFSFYDHAGPYDKAGYVFFLESVGYGVCQVATTTYDTALLGGLEIVERSPHSKKSVYVAGGLDATVASSDDGSWNIDMKFRNTYDYPIYIKAYDTDGDIHVEFWSNHDAKKGKTYSTESVWIGGLGYQTFLHTYQDGVEIGRDYITTTWYSGIG